jgi:hypothetical protein
VVGVVVRIGDNVCQGQSLGGGWGSEDGGSSSTSLKVPTLPSRLGGPAAEEAVDGSTGCNWSSVRWAALRASWF